MKDIKVPGFLWVLGIAVAIVAIETFVPGQYQFLSEAAIVALMGFVKAQNLGTEDVEELVALLKKVQARPAGVTGPESASAVSVARIDTEQYKPNKGVRWLAG